ncbi:MAG: chromate transporter [Betaproteobacteria bacterium]
MEEQAPKDLIGFLDFYLVKKAPFQIPDGGKEAIVKYGPWIVVVLLVISLPLVLFALGIGAILLPFAALGSPTAAGGFGFAMLVVCAELVLDVMSLPGLFARKMSGWNLIFYSRLLSIVSSLLMGAIVSAIVGGLIGLYILFQVRPLYQGSTATAGRATV